MFRVAFVASKRVIVNVESTIPFKTFPRCFASLPNAAVVHRPRKSLLLLGILGGCGVGAGYAYFNQKRQVLPKAILNESDSEIVMLQDLPGVDISRKIKYATDSSNLRFVLFQYPTCPFCCKVRAFLDANGLSYDVVEVNPVLRQQLKWTNYKKVPILLVKTDSGYLQLNDSSMIISVLHSYLRDKDSILNEVVKYYPTISFQDDDGTIKKEILNKYFLMFKRSPANISKEDIESERKWRKWADDNLVHVLSPNVYRTNEEALESFNWFSEIGEWDKLFPSWERNLVIYVGAFAMWIIGKRLKKRHNLKHDVRESLYDSCNTWIKEVKQKGKGPFHGGLEPNLADLAVFGVLTSIEGCRAFTDLTNNTKISSWYNAMKQFLNRNERLVL